MAVSAASHREERWIEVEPGSRLWADATGDPDATPLLLVMGANATGIAWPEALVTRLAERHRVLRYDHRDTGRSTRAFARRPYPITQLARDALAVVDGFGVDRAHVAGMSLGGMRRSGVAGRRRASGPKRGGARHVGAPGREAHA